MLPLTDSRRLPRHTEAAQRLLVLLLPEDEPFAPGQKKWYPAAGCWVARRRAKVKRIALQKGISETPNAAAGAAL